MADNGQTIPLWMLYQHSLDVLYWLKIHQAENLYLLRAIKKNPEYWTKSFIGITVRNTNNKLP